MIVRGRYTSFGKWECRPWLSDYTHSRAALVDWPLGKPIVMIRRDFLSWVAGATAAMTAPGSVRSSRGEEDVGLRFLWRSPTTSDISWIRRAGPFLSSGILPGSFKSCRSTPYGGSWTTARRKALIPCSWRSWMTATSLPATPLARLRSSPRLILPIPSRLIGNMPTPYWTRPRRRLLRHHVRPLVRLR